MLFLGPKLPPKSYNYVYRAVQRRPFNDKTVEILSLPQKYRMCRLHRPPRFGKTTALAMLDLFNDISTPDEYIERAFKVCLVVCSQSPLQRCKIHHFTTGHASVGNRLDGEEKILLYHPLQLPYHWSKSSFIKRRYCKPYICAKSTQQSKSHCLQRSFNKFEKPGVTKFMKKQTDTESNWNRAL